jgi:hypothetical protein
MATDKGIAKIAAQRFNINAIATRRKTVFGCEHRAPV